MLSKLPLRTKLSVYVGTAMCVAVALCIALFALHAVTRIRAESESALRLANDFVSGALLSIQHSDNPEADLRKLIIEANNSRHVRVFSANIPAPQRITSYSDTPPSWFSQLLETKSDKIQIDLTSQSKVIDQITIGPYPVDEISEIWQEIKWISFASIGIVALTAFVISIVVSNTLLPINEYINALTRLDEGERSINISGNGSPEFHIITDKINRLSRTLSNLDDENHQLIQKMIKVQDNERKELAQDLHDEFGPVLFMARVGIGGLRKKIESLLKGTYFENDWTSVDQNIDRLQQINRRILGRLRPAALEDMGLIGAVEAMVLNWKKTEPSIDISCSYSDSQYILDETESLTAYRIIQEALTNIYRHSDATKATILIELQPQNNQHKLRLIIDDNGKGIKENTKKGIGLRGMEERILAVNGEIEISSLIPSGTRIEATIPVS